MNMGDDKLLLISDLENKKSYENRYSGDCGRCLEEMEPGDSIYFIGDKRVCEGCRINLVEYLEDQL